MRRAAGAGLAVLVLFALAGCREAARELANGPGGAPALSTLLDSLATRFGPVRMDPAFDALRPKLASAAMVPSRVFDATDVWAASGDGWRTLDFLGREEGGVYRLGVHASAAAPRSPGDYRGQLRLQRLGSGRFAWTMHEELAVGPVRPQDMAEALTVLYRTAGSVDGATARARAREALPRTTAALSRLLKTEALEIAPEGGGVASVRMAVRLVPDGIRSFAPRWAAFLDKQATPTRMRVVVADLPGATWWTLEGADDLWTLRLRVRDGSLVPLEGPADRGLPDTLRLTTDYSMKVGIFRIGVRHLVGEVALVHGPTEKGFLAQFREGPEWDLPFLVEPLMRSSLRYPFEGEGSHLGWSAREQAGGPTRLERRLRFQVKESWIVRWLGGASSSVLSEFRTGAESESDRFVRECLVALRDDLVALGSAPR